MFSLILAALYVACRVLFSNSEPLVAFENTLGFLWYWHMTFTVLKVIIWLAVPVIGGIFGVAGNSDEKLAGIAAVVLSPLLLFFMTLTSILFLGGVYACDSGIQNGEIVNQNHLVMGCILYFLGVLIQLRRTSTTSSNKD